MKNTLKVLAAIGLILAVIVCCVGVWAVIIKILSVCFGFTFMWRYVVGAMIITAIVKNMIKDSKNN